MKRIAIWGTSAVGEKVYKYLDGQKDISLVVVDKNEEKIGSKWHGLYVISPMTLYQMVKNKEIDAVIFAFLNAYQKEAAALFRDCDGIEGYVIPSHVQYFFEEFDENSFVKIDLSKPRIKQFDVNLVDHCNMKCKGCLRFSNLVEKPVYADFNKMIQDWERMKDLFWGVQRLKLMGGEPMLSPELRRYIVEARRIFPDADIMVTTNALLINDNCKELFQTMKENYVFFDISLYQPMEKKEEQLKEILEKNGVWYVFNYTKGDFYKVMSKTPSYDMVQAYEKCAAKDCHHLREGKLSVCSRPQYISFMNERYHTNIPENVGVWDIYDLKIDAWELDQKLSSPFEDCKYCAPPVSYKWGRADSSNAKMSDWFVDEEE